MTAIPKVGAGRALVLGRQAEQTAIDGFLGAVASGEPGVLLVSGPAGIGKTTLWQLAIEVAQSRRFTVVSARPTEVETRLAFAALGDILGPLLDPAPPELPEPQQAALDAALMRVPATTPPHPLGVSLATLHVLRAAGAAGPVIVAIDDGPWIDEASARALEFAIRRLETGPIGFLVAQRVAAATDPPPSWLATVTPERLRRIDLGPLTVDETGALLRDRLGLALRRPVLVRLHAISGGTPFYAIELGRDLQLRGTWETPDALDSPRTLDRLVGARISALEPAGADVALVAAALSSAKIAVLEAALGIEPTHAGITETEAAGVLTRAGNSLRFAHPLLAAAAYARARPDRVRDVHERLASIVSDPEERARHLARTTSRPDATVAAALDTAAAAARQRGAPEIAAELAEDAARLTPEDATAERIRRRLTAADHLLTAGDIVRADERLGEIAAGLPEGPILADVLVRRALVALYRTNVDLAEDDLHAAMSMTAPEEVERRITIDALLAGVGHLTWRAWRRARRHMWEALRLARELGDGPLHLQILGHAATWRFGLGRPWHDLIDEADSLDVPLDAVPTLEHPDLQFSRLLAREGQAADARHRIGRLADTARRRGDWTSLPRLLVSAAAIEVEAGDWNRADELAEEANSGLLQTGEGAFLRDLAIVRLWLDVFRGRVEEARAAGTALDLEVRDIPRPLVRAGPLLALGSLELSLGNADAALSWIERAVGQPGLGRLQPLWWEYATALWVESLVGVGRLAEARPIVDRLERRARRRGPSAALAEAVRARAVVLAAGGEIDAAVASAEESVAIHAGLELPFRAARASFTLGEVRRRARQRTAARAAFEAALEGFTTLGARTWIERATSEIGRVASRRPAGSALTDTERRVAELAAAGHTNKEIADVLFMSVHTVEAHLTRVFRALGVQSRTELARTELDGSAGGSAAQP